MAEATRELMPGVGIQVPPNLADWWPQLVAAGATDLGGLSANGDHISPEHPFPSPAPGAQAPGRQDGFALTERLCVYREYIDPEWIAQGVLDMIKTQLLVVHPAARQRAHGPPGADPPLTISPARDRQGPRRRAGSIPRS